MGIEAGEGPGDGPIETYKDREWLYQKYIVEERSMDSIGELCGVAGGTIHNYLTKYEIPTRSRSEARSNGDVMKLHDPEWLREQYVERERTTTDIADECGVHFKTVADWLRRHDISIRSHSERMTKGDLELVNDRDRLEELYVERGLSTRDIAERCGINKNTVLHRLSEFGIGPRPNNRETTNGDLERLNDPDCLRRLYWEEGMTMQEISEELHVHFSTVQERLNHFEIERRSQAEAIPSGADHPMWVEDCTHSYGPNWPEQRLAARVRDQGRCQQCGIHDGEHIERWSCVNHVHHISPRREFITDDGDLDYERANRLSNLITLCKIHHRKLEGVPIDNRHN